MGGLIKAKTDHHRVKDRTSTVVFVVCFLKCYTAPSLRWIQLSQKKQLHLQVLENVITTRRFFPPTVCALFLNWILAIPQLVVQLWSYSLRFLGIHLMQLWLNASWRDWMVKVTLKLQGKLYPVRIQAAWHTVQLQRKLDERPPAPQTRRNFIKIKWRIVLCTGNLLSLWTITTGEVKYECRQRVIRELYVVSVTAYEGQKFDVWSDVYKRAQGMDGMPEDRVEKWMM